MGEEKISPRDAEELAACFTAHARDLFGYACVITRGDRVLADDLVQAAFEAAGRAWWMLRDLAEGQRRGWLRRTLANIAVSGFRREEAFCERLPQIEARYRASVADTAEQAFSSMALQRCWQLINSMPQRQHAVALLRWQQGMKESEIAAVLGISEKTVSAHLHQARHKLIAQLGPDYPFPRDDPEGPPSRRQAAARRADRPRTSCWPCSTNGSLSCRRPGSVPVMTWRPARTGSVPGCASMPRRTRRCRPPHRAAGRGPTRRNRACAPPPR